MPINGEFSIYRFSSASDTESGISDKLEFNGDAVIPDSRSFIQHVKPLIGIIGQENQTPDSNNPSLVDETGTDIVGVKIIGYLDGSSSQSPFAIRLLRNWKKTDQKIAGLTFGRFGFRNNRNNEFDLTPSATSGYILQNFEIDFDYTAGFRFPFEINLLFQGDISDLNSTL